jgi:hypothetical protein
MDAFKISVKLFATTDDVSGHAFVPVFHKWIQAHALPDHLLVDVADYAHVADGPGSVLVAHEANIYADRTNGRLGLTYARKQSSGGTFQDRLRQAYDAARSVAQMLTREPSLDGLSFKTDEVLVRINDRLLAPNTPETFAKVERDVRAVFGSDVVSIDHEKAGAFGVTVRLGAGAMGNV